MSQITQTPPPEIRLPTEDDLPYDDGTPIGTLPTTIQLPTEDDLPSDDGIPMETPRHRLQMEVLINALDPWLEQREDGFIGGNMFVYFNADQLRNKDFRGPDFFAVLGVPKRERKSWVSWQEKKAPDVIIELLSDSTARFDKNEKKLIYQDRLRVSEYFWFNPHNPADWEGFLLEGGVYKPIAINPQGQRISRSLGLALVRWQGSYKGVNTTWLRWATLEGELLLLPQEIAEQAQIQAEQAQIQAEQARERAEQAEREREAENLARKAAIPKLLAMGLTPEQVAEALNLPLDAIAP